MIEDIVESTLSGKSIIGVFFSLKLIWCESKLPSDDRYFEIFASVYYMGFFSCKALNKNLVIIIFDFSI